MFAPSLAVARSRVSYAAKKEGPCLFCCQRRSAAVMPAPSTRATKKEPITLSPEVRAARREYQEDMDKMSSQIPQNMSAPAKMMLAKCSLALAESMSRNQAVFLYHMKMSPDMDRAFKRSMELASASLDEIYRFTFILRSKGSSIDAKFGRHLVRTCSVHGHEEATIQVVASLLRQDSAEPGILQIREALLAIDRLRNTSLRGNARALVLEAKLAERKGQPDRAIQLYEDALTRIMERDDDHLDDYDKLLDELSSPWIELAYLHLRQRNTKKALGAYMVGLDHDDPMAYYNLAFIEYRATGNQYTEEWLYNTTKAAASGYFKATYDLGRYYAEAPAPPVPTTDYDPNAPLLERLKGFASFLAKPTINLDTRANVGYHASYAQDPTVRVKMADAWLHSAVQSLYIPASLARARLFLQPFIYPSGNLSRPSDPFGRGGDPGAVRNPLFSPRQASLELTAVLAGCDIIRDAKRDSRTNTEYHQLAQPFTQYPEVLEAFENQLDELTRDAQRLADEAGIDVRAHEANQSSIWWEEPWTPAGVVYRHQNEALRGSGLYEEPPTPEKAEAQSST